MVTAPLLLLMACVLWVAAPRRQLLAHLLRMRRWLRVERPCAVPAGQPLRQV